MRTTCTTCDVSVTTCDVSVPPKRFRPKKKGQTTCTSYKIRNPFSSKKNF